jgi:putative transposase
VALDKVDITTAGKKHWLWRAVDQAGSALDVLVQSQRETMPSVEHRWHQGLNNRAGNSHQPTRRRERMMKRFRSSPQVRRFLSVHDQIDNVFTGRSNQGTAGRFHSARNQALTDWIEMTGVMMAA